MRLLERLFRSDNIIEIVWKITSMYNVKITRTTLSENLQRHPDYPSMLSVSDVLSESGVENVSILTNIGDLGQMPMPCIAPLRIGPEEKLAILTEVDNGKISFYDPETLRMQQTTIPKFDKQWATKVLMLTSFDNQTKEDKNYKKRVWRENQKSIQQFLLYAIVPIIALAACLLLPPNQGILGVSSILYTFVTLIGLGISSLLLLYEMNEHSPLLQQICKAGNKVNCSAVLSSSASRILGISWSAIGFVYFSGSIIFLLTQGIDNAEVLFLLSILNSVSLPYILFSIFYQWKVARQWCILCLSIQAILILQALSSFMGNWYLLFPMNDLLSSEILSGNIVVVLTLSFVIPILALYVALPALRRGEEVANVQRELTRFKHNSDIFNTMLKKQKVFTTNTDGLGITLGSKNPTHKIIKVCNPYCGPCAKAHVPIEELLKNNRDIQLQIIFSVPDDTPKADPVRHFLAIQEEFDQLTVEKALNDWYLLPEKRYENFCERYPLRGETSKQNEAVRKMYNWCEQEQIAFTPTIIVDGYQLPTAYNATDLKYLLTV